MTEESMDESSWVKEMEDSNCVMNEHGWRLAAFGELLGRGCIRPATIVQHFRTWLTPPSPSPPPGQTQVNVISSVITFSALDASYLEDKDWETKFHLEFKLQMSEEASVLPEDVAIIQVTEGSLAVSSLIRMPAEMSYEEFMMTLHDKPGAIFKLPSFNSFGNVDSRDVSVVTKPMILSPPPPSPPPPFPPNGAPMPPPAECECTGNYGAPMSYNKVNEMQYALDYGNTCGVKWDAVTPTCLVGGGSYGAGWCQQEWCYVPGHCPGATSTSFFDGYVPENLLFYSYDQCDGTDSFSETLEETSPVEEMSPPPVEIEMSPPPVEIDSETAESEMPPPPVESSSNGTTTNSTN
eukprot:gene28884-35882_t